MAEMKFTATCAAGLETLVAEEVKGFCGKEITFGPGSVSWSGSLETGYRACLWSRFASRVLLEVASFEAQGEEALYEQVRAVPWNAHLSTEKTFAVDCTLGKDAPFSHSQYIALRAKDGIVDYFRSLSGVRPNVAVNRPSVQVHVHSEPRRTTLCIDLSGEGLHRRGYRKEHGDAPLKETLAAAIIALSGWDLASPLVDPLCGSGTLLIEAAMIFGDVAPGLGRSYFGLQGWLGHDKSLWGRLINEASEREEAGFNRQWPRIIGSDASRKAVRSALGNCQRSGFTEQISITRKPLFMFTSATPPGLVVTNPPYGERLSEKEVVKYLYRCIGNRLKQHFNGWRIGLFTSNPDLADMTGLAWAEKHNLHNGPLSCRLYLTTVDSPAGSSFTWKISPRKEGVISSDFSNRLRKNLKQLNSWVKREGVECYRVFDRDMAEYNVTVDLYGKQVHVREYAPPSSINETAASKRFQTVLQGVRQVLGVGRDRVYVKTRRYQKKTQQSPGKKRKHGRLFEVREAHCSLLVNLTDSPNTGLLLDHRNIRLRIGRESRGKTLLNLFGNTGAATVHAALGGAAKTTTVDLSQSALRWAEMNFALNGISTENHKLIAADSIRWLQRSQDHFDIILLAPPPVSKHRKKSRLFDLQKDHVSLLEGAISRLKRGGVLIFTTAAQSFQLDSTLTENYSCKNISSQMMPRDFTHPSRVHQCWEIQQKP